MSKLTQDMYIQMIIIIIIASLISGLGGFVIGKNHYPITTEAVHNRLSPMHAHDPREVDSTLPIPSIELAVNQDPKSGYNLQIITTNFSFAPERASTAYVAGEGHAHLYINQKRIGRLYGEWYHISSLPKGPNLIRVGLSGNDHTELTLDDTPIAAEIIVTVE